MTRATHSPCGPAFGRSLASVMLESNPLFYISRVRIHFQRSIKKGACKPLFYGWRRGVSEEPGEANNLAFPLANARASGEGWTVTDRNANPKKSVMDFLGLAEREGFEPSEHVSVHLISSQARSASSGTSPIIYLLYSLNTASSGSLDFTRHIPVPRPSGVALQRAI